MSRLGCASSAGSQGAELGTVWRRSAPLQQRSTDKQPLETMTKYFKKRGKTGPGKKRLRVAKAGKKKPAWYHWQIRSDLDLQQERVG